MDHIEGPGDDCIGSGNVQVRSQHLPDTPRLGDRLASYVQGGSSGGLAR